MGIRRPIGDWEWRNSKVAKLSRTLQTATVGERCMSEEALTLLPRLSDTWADEDKRLPHSLPLTWPARRWRHCPRGRWCTWERKSHSGIDRAVNVSDLCGSVLWLFQPQASIIRICGLGQTYIFIRNAVHKLATTRMCTSWKCKSATTYH